MSNKITDEEIERILNEKAEEIENVVVPEYMFNTEKVFQRIAEEKKKKRKLFNVLVLLLILVVVLLVYILA